MIDEIYKTMKESVGKSQDALRNTLSRVRTGRANASLLDAVRVDYYGAKTPLNQMATISTPSGRPGLSDSIFAFTRSITSRALFQ